VRAALCYPWALGKGKIEQAKSFALQAHGDQRYGEHPYSLHLAEVASIAREFDAPPEVCLAAWLHDVLEDTPLTFDELTDTFGLGISELVFAVTNKPGKSRSASHALTYPALREAGALAVLLKLCDRLTNARASAKSSPKKLKMYQEEFQSFRDTLYLAGEHEQLWAELDALLR
jgi:(p)ppGpp synthase/HD superfamily hydrolase